MPNKLTDRELLVETAAMLADLAAIATSKKESVVLQRILPTITAAALLRFHQLCGGDPALLREIEAAMQRTRDAAAHVWTKGEVVTIREAILAGQDPVEVFAAMTGTGEPKGAA